MARRLAKVGLLVTVLAVTLIAAEQLLRAVGFEYRPMSIDVANPSDARLFHLFEDSHFEHDPKLIWRPKTDYAVFNTQGFRGPVLAAEKPPGEIRIFALGDSNTLGWAGPEGPNWPAFLEQRFEVAGAAGVAVVNAGVWGYSSYQGRVRLEEILAYQPDVVLVSFGSNDAHLVTRSDREFARRSLLGRETVSWLMKYRLGQLTAAAWDRAGAGGEVRHRVPLDEYRDNLREMARMAREAGAEIVLLTRPFTGPVRDPGWWKNFGHEYNLATVQVAEELGIPVIDIYSLFKLQESLFSDESHFTRAGHQLAAEIIFRHLRSLDSLPARPTAR